MATTAVKNQQQAHPNLAGMATVLLAAAACGLFLFAPSPSLADPPSGEDPKLHPGHLGHIASGRTYPGVPATEYHEAVIAGVDPYPTGPGGWAEEKSGGANANRAVEYP